MKAPITAPSTMTVMSIQANDLVVRLDEARSVIQLLVPKNGTVDLRVFHEFSEAQLESALGIERELGIALLSFLSATYSSSRFELSRYREAGSQLVEEQAVMSAAQHVPREADEDFEAAMLLIRRVGDATSLDHLDEISALIRSAASRGSSSATRYLANQWPALNEVLRKRIARSS